MLKVLVKKQLIEIFRSYFYNAKKNKAYSKGATAAYVVLFVMLMVGVLGGIFTGMALMICKPMAEAEVEWFYFALMGLTAILLGAFGSVFNTFSSLYLSKDNDLLPSHTGFCDHDLKADECIPDGADVFRCCNTSGSDCLLGYCGILCKSSGRWYFISGTDFHICNDTFLCPWLDCGKDQPEAET